MNFCIRCTFKSTFRVIGLKSLFTLTIAWEIAKIGDTWMESDFSLICGYFFVTENHNKTENKILSFRTL
jgi:hypothetical protein